MKARVGHGVCVVTQSIPEHRLIAVVIFVLAIGMALGMAYQYFLGEQRVDSK